MKMEKRKKRKTSEITFKRLMGLGDDGMGMMGEESREGIGWELPHKLFASRRRVGDHFLIVIFLTLVH